VRVNLGIIENSLAWLLCRNVNRDAKAWLVQEHKAVARCPSSRTRRL